MALTLGVSLSASSEAFLLASALLFCPSFSADCFKASSPSLFRLSPSY